MGSAREVVRERLSESVADVFIEEQLHATELANRRSRAAAKARQARMSSRVRSGKSVRTWSSVMPAARYSNTSYTVILVPLTQGLPLRTPGFIEIRCCQFMRQLYFANSDLPSYAKWLYESFAQPAGRARGYHLLTATGIARAGVKKSSPHQSRA